MLRVQVKPQTKSVEAFLKSAPKLAKKNSRRAMIYGSRRVATDAGRHVAKILNLPPRATRSRIRNYPKKKSCAGWVYIMALLERMVASSWGKPVPAAATYVKRQKKLKKEQGFLAGMPPSKTGKRVWPKSFTADVGPKDLVLVRKPGASRFPTQEAGVVIEPTITRTLNRMNKTRYPKYFAQEFARLMQVDLDKQAARAARGTR